MKPVYAHAHGKPAKQEAGARAGKLEKLAAQLNESVDTVRTFAKISDPVNAKLFTAAAARKAFAHVKVKF